MQAQILCWLVVGSGGGVGEAFSLESRRSFYLILDRERERYLFSSFPTTS